MTEKKRSGRNVKVTITNKLPEGVTEEEYKLLEEIYEPDDQPHLLMLETVGNKQGMLWAEEIY